MDGKTTFDWTGITDPSIRDELCNLDQDPRPGTAGFWLHQRLESEALEVGQAVVEAHAPALLPAYRVWRRRFTGPC